MQNERNAFQQLMHSWNQLHPYNAVTIVKVAGAADAGRLSRAIAKVHETLGISRLLSRDGSYELDGHPCEPLVEEVEDVEQDGRDDLAVLADRATLEINRPFGPGPSFPVRLFVLPRAGYHYIGRTYQHWVGDAYFMYSLLCRVLAEYLGVEAPATLGATDRACPTFRRTFARAIGPHRWCGLAGQVAGELLRFRRCYRPPYGDESDVSARVSFPALPGEILASLQAAARRFGVSINELALAALAEAIALSTPERLTAERQDLALMSMVDARPLDPQRLMDKMGLYLSYFNVFCKGEDQDFSRLLATIHAQSDRAKAGRRYLKSAIELQLAVTLWPWIPPEQRVGYFSHRKPLAAGLTNLRLRDDWLSGELGRAICGWWRAASTGPMSPLVVLITTAGGRLTCGVSSRASGFAPPVVDAIVSRFTERLATLS